MTENASFNQNMDTVFSDLHNFVKSDSVLGTPLPVGEKTLVPVISITLGYGSADMPKKTQNNNTSNNGVGLGARISTDAVVVIEKNSVNMLNVGEQNNMGQIMSKIPEAITSISQTMSKQGQQGQQGQQNQQSQNPSSK